MNDHEDRRVRRQAALIRLLMLVTVGGAFVTMGSFLSPEQSRAMPSLRDGLAILRPSKPAIPPNAAKPPSRSSTGGMLLGEMVGAENRVWVYGKGTEVQYTVCTLQGDVLMADMAADEVYRLFPHLDLMGMQLDPTPDVKENVSGPLMIMDSSQSAGGN